MRFFFLAFVSATVAVGCEKDESFSDITQGIQAEDREGEAMDDVDDSMPAADESGADESGADESGAASRKKAPPSGVEQRKSPKQTRSTVKRDVDVLDAFSAQLTRVEATQAR